MAKKKQPTNVAAKNPSDYPSSSNKHLAKKPAEVASTSKKPSDVASLAKKAAEVASNSKKPLNDVTASKNKKQPEPVKNPPPESSSEEEDESESEGEEEEGPCKEDSGKNPVTPSASAPVVAATVIQSSDSESESETEGESDSETETATTKTAPPATATATAAASASPSKKRHSEGDASTELNASKRAKTESGTASKGLFQRIWSEQDEIVLLQGILDFRSNTGKSHSDDLSGYFESVKNSISFEVSSVHQCSSKISSLKKKYLGKWKNGDEPRWFKKPHDKRCLELAKMVWGTADVDSTAVKSKIKTEVGDGSLKIDDADVDADWFEESSLAGSIANLGVFLNEASVKARWSTVPAFAKKQMMEKWKSMEAIEIQWVSMKTDLMNDISSWIAKSD